MYTCILQKPRWFIKVKVGLGRKIWWMPGTWTKGTPNSWTCCLLAISSDHSNNDQWSIFWPHQCLSMIILLSSLVIPCDQSSVISVIINNQSSVISVILSDQSSVISVIINDQSSVISVSINDQSSVISVIINYQSSVISVIINGQSFVISVILSDQSSGPTDDYQQSLSGSTNIMWFTAQKHVKYVVFWHKLVILQYQTWCLD